MSSDIYPESGSRLPPIRRDALDEQGKQQYDALAARTGRPVAPIAIRGTRTVLGGGQVWPRWNRIEIEVLEALPAGAGAGDAAAALRDRARTAIAAASGEPLL